MVATGQRSSVNQAALEIPKNCPHCCRGVHLERVRINQAVTPWGQVKSRRGRKKEYSTHGWACQNPACPSFGITEEAIHALVRPTLRGKDQDILYLRYPCCQTVFSSRKGAPLYYLKTKAERVELCYGFWLRG